MAKLAMTQLKAIDMTILSTGSMVRIYKLLQNLLIHSIANLRKGMMIQ